MSLKRLLSATQSLACHSTPLPCPHEHSIFRLLPAGSTRVPFTVLLSGPVVPAPTLHPQTVLGHQREPRATPVIDPTPWYRRLSSHRPVSPGPRRSTPRSPRTLPPLRVPVPEGFITTSPRRRSSRTCWSLQSHNSVPRVEGEDGSPTVFRPGVGRRRVETLQRSGVGT